MLANSFVQKSKNMKKNLLSIMILSFLIPCILKSQDHKFGHIDMWAIITQLPEYKKSSDSLQKIGNDYAKVEQQLQAEIQQKSSDLMKNQDKMDTVVRQSRLSELQTMQTNMEQFRQMANERMQKIESELVNSMINKVSEAVRIISTELGLTYVFDISQRNNVIIYKSEKSIDLLPKVKEKLKL
jgi:outer membrane protein